jgi:hypothetical protein
MVEAVEAVATQELLVLMAVLVEEVRESMEVVLRGELETLQTPLHPKEAMVG